MFAKVFIDRPVLAWVISIVITLGGLAALAVLPIAQYPEIAPPTISVTALYPGANATVVADTVAAPIEQQINGVERMMYMSSQSTNDGMYQLTITFELGTDLNTAQVLVQNRVQLAVPQLPQEVQRQGLNVKKKSPEVLLVVNLLSPEATRDGLYLSNYATIQVKDELARLPGVGDVTLFGQQDYAMRAWLDPDKLRANELTTNDVVNAIKAQNVQVAAGQLGQEPAPPGQSFQYTLTTLGRLTMAEEFEEIIVKVASAAPPAVVPGMANNGPVGVRPAVRLRDVARVELTSKNQDVSSRLDGKPTVGLAIFQLPGANALNVADEVRLCMERLKVRFPNDVEYKIVYDTTPFIEESIQEVYKTLIEAVVLVAIVVLMFLQDWRAMILPMIDVPVSLIGTLAIMALLGFSLNNLTLFGLVLAIGIVVDDAIVVLENVERFIAQGHDGRTATLLAMREITGPIIAITLVLSSVFLPSAFLPGITGQFYQQFALTIAASMMISAINAMTLTPSRAASIFSGHGHHTTETLPWYGWGALLGFASAKLLQKLLGSSIGLESLSTPVWYGAMLGLAVPGIIAGVFLAKWINDALRVVYKYFNKGFDKVAIGYGWGVRRLIRLSILVVLGYIGLLVLTGYGFLTTPTGFVPFQDKGYLLVNVQLPDAAGVQRTRVVMDAIDARIRATKGVAHTINISGQSVLLGANGSNYGTIFIILDEFEHRVHDPEQNGFAILFRLQAELRREIQDATVGVFPAPPVSGVGAAGGFKVIVQDRGDLGPSELETQANALIGAGAKDPGISGMFTQYRANVPQLYVDVDRVRCMQMGLPISDVFNTLQVNLGGAYVNDFTRFGRNWQVQVQADAPFRINADTVKNLRVRNDQGQMVP
ncbi:MAG: efflux RND transporter permease subunit, partial [Gemmataceae bacterium]